MQIEIKPFNKDYSVKCADLLQYLWDENREGRMARFNWAYLQNPNTCDTVTAVIAINEKDEVVGFRGYHTLKAYFGDNERRVAYIADTVVSPYARRQGILQKMTDYSFQFLLDNDIFCISNLGPSWPPYYGYKKLHFEDLHEFTSRYKIYPGRLLFAKLLENQYKKPIDEYVEKKENYSVYISNKIPNDKIVSQIKDEKKDGIIMPCRSLETLKWKASHPNSKYVFVYALNKENELKAMLWFKLYKMGVYNLGIYQQSDTKAFRACYNLFKSKCQPTVVAAWDWAITEESKKALDKLFFHRIPFLSKIRKNPPAIVRTLVNSESELSWTLDGIDIRQSNNWIVDKIEGDSF